SSSNRTKRLSDSSTSQHRARRLAGFQGEEARILERVDSFFDVVRALTDAGGEPRRHTFFDHAFGISGIVSLDHCSTGSIDSPTTVDGIRLKSLNDIPVPGLTKFGEVGTSFVRSQTCTKSSNPVDTADRSTRNTDKDVTGSVNVAPVGI